MAYSSTFYVGPSNGHTARVCPHYPAVIDGDGGRLTLVPDESRHHGAIHGYPVHTGVVCPIEVPGERGGEGREGEGRRRGRERVGGEERWEGRRENGRTG